MSDSQHFHDSECSDFQSRIEILQQHILAMRNTYSNNYFETLIEDMPLAYHSLDQYGRIIRVNKSWIELMEYEMSEVLGIVITKYFTKKSLALFQRKFPVFKQTGFTKNTEFEFITKSGKIIVCEISGRIEYDKHGVMVVSHCILNDITFRKQIEREMREAKQNWQHMFQAISSPTVILNPDFTIVYANDAVIKASKLPINEIIGQPCCRVFHGKHVTQPPKDCPTKKLLEHIHVPQVAEMEIEAFNGTFLVSCTPIFTNEGKLDKVIHIATDITPIKKMSAAIEENEKRFRELADYLPQTVYECALDGTFSYVNKSGLSMFGYTQEDVRNGLNILQMLAPEEIEKAKANIELLYKQGSNSGNEYIAKHKNGSTFPVKIYTNVVIQQGKPTGLRGILIDLSEQKQAEFIIQENQRVLSSLMSNTPGLLYRCKYDTQWSMIFISEQCIAITGYSPDDFIDNKTLAFNDVIAAEFQNNISEEWVRCIEHKSKFTYEYQIIHKSGERRWVYESGNPVFDDAGNVMFLEGYIEDITEQKQTEFALRHSLLALSQPLDSTENIVFSDLFNLEDIQTIQDEFSNATGVASIITDPSGVPITKPSNFTRLCSSIIRNTKIGKQNCYNSDAKIGCKCTTGPTVQPCLSGGLLDAGASIVIGNKHIANWLIGQVRTEDVNENKVLQYADTIGVDTEEFKKAFQEVPKMSQTRFESIAKLLYTIAQELSFKAYQNIQQARFIKDIQKNELILKEKNDEVEAQNEEYQQLNEELNEANIALHQAKETALKNEEQYRLLFAEMEQGIAVHEVIYNEEGKVVDYRFIDINPAYERITGLTREMALHKRVREILPNVEEYWIETFGNVAVTGIPTHYENTAAELKKHFEVVAYRPQANQFAVIVTDITDRKQAELLLKEKNDEIEAQNEEYLQLNEELAEANRKLEEAKELLQEKEEKYRELVETSQDLIWQCDLEGHFTYINPICKQILGYTQEELLGRKFTESLKYDIRDRDMEVFKQILQGVDIKGFESIHVHKNGSDVYLIFNAKPLYNALGEVVGTGGTAYDITELKRAERALRLSEDKYKLMVSNTDVVSFIIDKQGIFTLSEGKALDKLGLKPGQVVGMSAYDVYKDFPQITTSIERVLHGEVIREELMIAEVVFDILYSPIFDENNSVIMLIGLAVDITERKKSELLLKAKNDEVEAQNEEYMQLNEELVSANQELYLAKQKAEESDRLKSAFLANLSHEIRTPMNAILGFSDLLADKDISYEHRCEYVNIVQKSGKHLLTIINDLIDVSKIETGQVVPFYSEISLQTFLKDLYNTLHVTIPEDKQVNFSIELEHIDSTTKLISDEVKLRQIIINIVTNALKFTDSGFVTIECEYTNQNELVCKVKDSGIGIAQEYYSAIFDRFRQVEGDIAIKKGGSGLGLAISKAYAEMLGGSISVSSELGKGSTFTLSIPNYTEYKKPKKVHKQKETIDDQLGNNETILVAEDDDVNYYYLTKIMAKTNYNIIRALNGEEAVSIVKNNPNVKLILMDIKMPKMNGYEATNIIRSLDATIPVIAQTAYALSDEQEKIRQTNFTDYVSKPLKRDVLLELIKKHIIS
ncbi:MAG: Aerobic respiration control sensor protein ArcB [Bacteroidetes bacterium ADurb.Bin217]|nr:MAG: Aerobic respiration control sensor protein ArcB [Bacteroidetes bacterium ADurb.Bin217]